jgi:hypothetical protein
LLAQIPVVAKVKYKESFFEGHKAGSIASAEVIIPVVLKYVKAESVVDVGCGIGAWLSVFKKHGINDITGIDGDFVNRTQLLISKDDFIATDLNSPPALNRKYELATCLEVAEHLKPSSASAIVKYLTQLSEVILFSAAVPFQGGEGHINEHFQNYWVELFETYDYKPIDCIRPFVWSSPQIQWWYAQNIFLFAKASRIQTDEILRGAYQQFRNIPFNLVHPRLLTAINDRSFLSVLKELYPRFKLAVKRRIKHKEV